MKCIAVIDALRYAVSHDRLSFIRTKLEHAAIPENYPTMIPPGDAQTMLALVDFAQFVITAERDVAWERLREVREYLT